MSYGEAEKGNGGFPLGQGRTGTWSLLLTLPIGTISRGLKLFQLTDSGLCGKVYYELPSSFPDSSRGCTSYLPFLCHRHN